MAGTTLDQLTPAISLNGSELVWIYQQGPNESTPWIGLRCTTFQIADLINGSNAQSCSMRQLLAAMANNGVLVTAYEALPADLNNSYNIAWNHAYRMAITDPFITGFLEPAIGYNATQMAALFALAQTFPV